MKRFVSVILSLCLMAGIVIPSNISNAASYVRLPSSESASETSCLKSASVASSSASSSKPDGCTNEESIDIGKTITSSVSSGDNWFEAQEGDKWYALTIPADTAYKYVLYF